VVVVVVVVVVVGGGGGGGGSGGGSVAAVVVVVVVVFTLPSSSTLLPLQIHHRLHLLPQHSIQLAILHQQLLPLLLHIHQQHNLITLLFTLIPKPGDILPVQIKLIGGTN